MAHKRLGEILIEDGVLDEDKIQKALKFQTQHNCLIGEAFVKLAFATDEQVAQALSKQLGIPFASTGNKILAPEKGQELEKIIPEKYAREHLLVPLFKESGSLAVAMMDPTDVLIVDNLRLMSNMEIQPFISTKAQILNTIDSFYQATDLIEAAMITQDSGDGVGEDLSAVDGKLDLDKVIVGDTKGAQSIRVVNAILKQAISERTSDIHLEIFDERVSLRFRIDGVLFERTPPPKELVAALISRIKILSKLDIAERRLPQDGNFAIKYQNRTIEVRVSVCPTVFGEKLVLRVLDKGSVELNIEKLGFEPRQREDFLKAAAYPHGLIFLTGPTGSGKTTTLNAILNTIKTPEMNFMTLEDPVEYKLQGISQVQVKPQIGLTFAAGLRSFLRQDPDVILVGEVRDQETAESCLRAALTGHLVLSTLHTNEALGAVPRLIDMGMEPFLLSSSLALVASQRLIRMLCPSCKQPYKPEQAIVDQLLRECNFKGQVDTSKWVFYQARGCDKCSRTGYKGRRGIYEVYLINEEMRQIIYKTQDLADLRVAGAKTGAWNLRASGWRKVVQGVTTVDEVLSATVSEG
ncbi:MAG: ATPase, T2SS/T4P/T4SS family [Elusimicrobiaceae bacterium]|nr:ATPase, T2SS/T4P/T4SS family [Elusimicrobiaceae bacterium]